MTDPVTDAATDTAADPTPQTPATPATVPPSAQELPNLAAKNMKAAFATPVFAYLWDDMAEMNKELEAEILRRETAGEGLDKSNVGGWHSHADLLKWDLPAVEAFKQRLQRFAGDVVRSTTKSDAKRRYGLRMDAWANVSRNGNYNSAHDHPMAHWSGVYYVTAGTPRPGMTHNGRLELFDPRAGVNSLSFPNSTLDKRFVVETKPGLMVVFPSWLKHMVHPFFGEGARISIAFNVAIQTALPED